MLFSAGGEPEIVRFAEEVARKLRFTGHRAFDFNLLGEPVRAGAQSPRHGGMHLLSPKELTGSFSSGERGRRSAPAGPK